MYDGPLETTETRSPSWISVSPIVCINLRTCGVSSGSKCRSSMKISRTRPEVSSTRGFGGGSTRPSVAAGAAGGNSRL